MKLKIIKLFLLIISPVFASPHYLVNTSIWDNSIYTEYGQSFKAVSDEMHGVKFYLNNTYSAPGPFDVAVYELPDTANPIGIERFSLDGADLSGLIEVNFTAPIATTIGQDYLFTIKRNGTDTYDIGLNSLTDSYADGEIAVRLGPGSGDAMVFNPSRDLSFSVVSDAGASLSNLFQSALYDTPTNLIYEHVLNGDRYAVKCSDNLNRIVVLNSSENAVYVYSDDNASGFSQLGSAIPAQEATIFDVEISGDGRTVLVTEQNYNGFSANNGVAFIYRLHNGEWISITSPIREISAGDLMYKGIINSNGTIVVMSSPWAQVRAGSARIFEEQNPETFVDNQTTSTVWNLTGTISGTSQGYNSGTGERSQVSAISADGVFLATSGGNPYEVWKKGSSWVKIFEGPDNGYGTAGFLAMSYDGNYILTLDRVDGNTSTISLMLYNGSSYEVTSAYSINSTSASAGFSSNGQYFFISDNNEILKTYFINSENEGVETGQVSNSHINQSWNFGEGSAILGDGQRIFTSLNFEGSRAIGVRMSYAPYAPTNEYHLIEHELTWDQCLAYARHYGGELAAITSEDEEAYVTSWLDDQIGEQDSEVFLGGSDADVEDAWTWSSGETWDYENWYDGEPNNQNGDEDYLQLTHNSVINWDWKWNDFDGNGADATYYMLIEAADTSSMPTGVVITAATDSDGDGLADIVEIQTYGTDPNDADSDDDGFSDSLEVSINPTVDNSNLWAEIMDTDTIKDIRAGSTIIGIDEQSGSGTITMILEETDNLSSSNWTAFGEAINVNITPSNNVRFYRFKMND